MWGRLSDLVWVLVLYVLIIYVGNVGMSRYLSRKKTTVRKHLSYENGCSFQNF